jgi:hypothetical protein
MIKKEKERRTWNKKENTQIKEKGKKEKNTKEEEMTH